MKPLESVLLVVAAAFIVVRWQDSPMTVLYAVALCGVVFVAGWGVGQRCSGEE
jgi:hypothetical protein